MSWANVYIRVPSKRWIEPLSILKINHKGDAEQSCGGRSSRYPPHQFCVMLWKQRNKSCEIIFSGSYICAPSSISILWSGQFMQCACETPRTKTNFPEGYEHSSILQMQKMSFFARKYFIKRGKIYAKLSKMRNAAWRRRYLLFRLRNKNWKILEAVSILWKETDLWRSVMYSDRKTSI